MLMRKISTIAKLFGTILSIFLSGKVTTINKMSLTDKEEINADDYNTAKVLNTFFSTIANKLNITEYSNRESLANNISAHVLKCAVKYRNHPSIFAIE